MNSGWEPGTAKEMAQVQEPGPGPDSAQAEAQSGEQGVADSAPARTES